MFFFIKHRVAAVSAFEKNFADIIKIVIEMETDDILSVCDAFDRDGLIDDTGNGAPVKRSGDNAGRFIGSPFRLYFRLAQDNAGCAVGSRFFHRVRLISADENTVPAAAAFIGGRKSNHDISGNRVDGVVKLIYNPAFNYTQQIKQGQFVDTGIINSLHVVGGNIPG